MVSLNRQRQTESHETAVSHPQLDGRVLNLWTSPFNRFVVTEVQQFDPQIYRITLSVQQTASEDREQPSTEDPQVSTTRIDQYLKQLQGGTASVSQSSEAVGGGWLLRLPTGRTK